LLRAAHTAVATVAATNEYSVPGVDGFTNQPWMLEAKYLSGLSSTATQVFRRFVELYGPYIEADVQETNDMALEQQPKL
jgi:hypothetical protein